MIAILLLCFSDIICGSTELKNSEYEIIIKRNELISIIKKSISNINSEVDVINYLYDICVEDDYCKNAYYQKNSKNINTFTTLVRNVISKLISENQQYTVHVDPYDTLSSLLLHNSNSVVVKDSQSISSTYNSIMMNGASYSDFGNNINSNDAMNPSLSIIKNTLNNDLVYSLYHFQMNGDNPICFPGQKMITSEDGMHINCICEETQNCSQEMFDMTYINLSLAFLIVLGLLILSIFSFRLLLDWSIFKVIMEKNQGSVRNHMSKLLSW